MSQLFAGGGQSTGVSASASVLPTNTQDWSPLGWTGWISFQSKGLSSLLQHHSSKAPILGNSFTQLFSQSHSHIHTQFCLNGHLLGWVTSLSICFVLFCFHQEKIWVSDSVIAWSQRSFEEGPEVLCALLTTQSQWETHPKTFRLDCPASHSLLWQFSSGKLRATF